MNPEPPSHDQQIVVMPETKNYTPAFIAMYIGLALSVAGVCYSLTRLARVRNTFQTRQGQLERQMAAQNEQLRLDLSNLEIENSRQLEALRAELDETAQRLGSKSGGELSRARAMVARLQQIQQRQADELRRELAKKADAEKIGTLSHAVLATRSDLGTTQKKVDNLARDLGMTRSELGTLVARNHDEIETLRRLGERDYFEFTLSKNQSKNIAGVGLLLKKTNVRRHSYHLNLIESDVQIENKDHNVNQPIFFYVDGSTKPYELVVNEVGPSTVKGYLSTPKGAVRGVGQVASGD
jgi:hypothetical protein